MKNRLINLFGAILLAALLLPSTSQAVTSIAYGGEPGVYGYCYNSPSIKSAEACAMRQCRKYGPGCRVEVTSPKPGYGAVAISPYAIGVNVSNATRDGAREQALEQCVKDRGPSGCRVTDVWYDSHGVKGHVIYHKEAD